MFYQEASIVHLLNCQNCKLKYDEPRLMPCGKTVCNRCIRSFYGSQQTTVSRILFLIFFKM